MTVEEKRKRLAYVLAACQSMPEWAGWRPKPASHYNKNREAFDREARQLLAIMHHARIDIVEIPKQAAGEANEIPRIRIGDTYLQGYEVGKRDGTKAAHRRAVEAILAHEPTVYCDMNEEFAPRKVEVPLDGWCDALFDKVSAAILRSDELEPKG